MKVAINYDLLNSSSIQKYYCRDSDIISFKRILKLYFGFITTDQS